jgi:hypothetical protein
MEMNRASGAMVLVYRARCNRTAVQAVSTRMKPRMFATVFGVIALLSGLPAIAQLSAYRFKPARLPVGTVFTYEKSQLDGSHLTRVSVYVAAVDRVESLKWDPDGDEATLVQAVIDWPRFSVRRFDAWHLARNVEAKRSATLGSRWRDASHVAHGEARADLTLALAQL